jgi:glucose/arabinose dehydrogenase
MRSWVALPLFALTLHGCGRLATRAADQAAPHSTRVETAGAIVVPSGLRIRRVVEGLTYPSSIAWDTQGTLYVLESHTVPIPLLEPRILAVREEGAIEPIPLEGPDAPDGPKAVGLYHRDGWLYFSHQQKSGAWGISRVRPSGGAVEAILRDLPAAGDHGVNYLEFDADGALYFGMGSATNSGVVSSHDPVNLEWIEQRPETRDLACADLVLTGAAFEDDNALTPGAGDRARTGAFAAYGTAPGRVAGTPLCTSSVYRLPAGGDRPELVAWGFRNPVALAWDPSGSLLVGMHGADVRGTRPVRDDPDAIYRLRQGAWYGWPDFSAALLPVTDERYRADRRFFPAGQDRLGFLIDHRASALPPPDRSLLVATTEPHAALGGMTVVPAEGPFARWAGRLLLSEMGDFRPTTDPANPHERAGFQIESVELPTGRRETFARNRGAGDPQPASALDLEDGLERPVDVKFGPDGNLYVLDYGVFEPTAEAAKVLPKTGKIFRIEPVAGAPVGK